MKPSANGRGQVLFIEHDPELLRATLPAFEAVNCGVVAALSEEDGLLALGQHRFDLVLADLAMPGLDAGNFCQRIKTDPSQRGVFVVLISPAGRVGEPQRSELAQADGWVKWPVSTEELAARIAELVRIKHAEDDLRGQQELLEQRTTELAKANELLGEQIEERKRAEEALRKSYGEIQSLRDRLQAENDYLKQERIVSGAQGLFVAESKGMKEVEDLVEQVASTPSTVLLQGETGTGKELIAQAIHHLSPRRDRVMVKVNCAALPAALVESELFGRERGAYTDALTRQAGRFEIADGSTIFLDEIGEIPPEVQVKLLRVLQEGTIERLGNPRPLKVNVRVIAATNRDLAAEIQKGRFREDLFYRMNVFPIKVPALRDRPEDVPVLVWAFIEEFCSRMGKKITKVPQKSMDMLQRHSWPGNVRELRNVIEHSVIITHGETLKVPPLASPAEAVHKVMTLAENEREHILATLEVTRWRIKGPKGAAEQLGMKPSTLYSRMAKLGVPTRREKDQAAH